MSGVRDRERMNSLFQEMKLHYLTEPEPSVNADHDLTLTWPLRTAEVAIVIGTTIRLTVSEAGYEIGSMDLTGLTDSEIIEQIILRNLTETKR